MHIVASAIDVLRLSYPDFVSFIGQDNTPPGGTRTLDQWCERAEINERSVILDLACSTGFSGRVVASKTRCVIIGVDISNAAICEARRRSAQVPRISASYLVGDVACLGVVSRSFTHILAGSAFGFFRSRLAAVRESHRVLRTNGTLCIATHYYTSRPPRALLTALEQSLGFRPCAAWTLNYWHSQFAPYFDLKWEESFDLSVLTNQEVAAACAHSISLVEEDHFANEAIRNTAMQRLVHLRLLINEQRKYQRYAIQIWNAK